MINDYLNKKLDSARKHINEKFGDKHYYSYEDILSLLKEFGTVFETTLDNVSQFIPSKGNDFTSIETFTKGFIKQDNAKILVLIQEKHFEVFVIELNKNLFTNYFSLNIDNNVLEILYYLESMKCVDKIVK